MALLGCALTHNLVLRTPAFVPLAVYPQLQANLFRDLHGLGVEAKQIRIEGASFQPQDLVVVCDLFRLGAVLRVRLDGVEFWTANGSTLRSPDTIIEATAGALRALRELDNKLEVGQVTQDLWAHGEMRQLVLDLLTRYVTTTPATSSRLRPAGVVFAGDVGQQGTSAQATSLVTVEPSVVHPGPKNVFLRVRTTFLETVDERSAHAMSMAFLDEMLRCLEISD